MLDLPKLSTASLFSITHCCWGSCYISWYPLSLWFHFEVGGRWGRVEEGNREAPIWFRELFAIPILRGVSPEDLAMQALAILAGGASLELKGKVRSRGGIILCLADRKPGGFWRQLPWQACWSVSTARSEAAQAWGCASRMSCCDFKQLNVPS